MYEDLALPETERWSKVTALVGEKLARFGKPRDLWSAEKVEWQYYYVKRDDLVLPHGLYKDWISDKNKISEKSEAKIREYRELEKQMGVVGTV